MEQVSNNGIKKYVRFMPWIFLIGLFIFLSVYMWMFGDRLTEADISSEMLLAKLLNEEHRLISKNWFYSTELRVLNIQIFYSLFFHIFRDWTMVRTATCMVSYLLMLVSYYYMLHQMGYDRIYAVSAIFLLLPVSDGYFEFVLLALLYASFISICFFAIGMVFHYGKASARMKKILLILTIILAFMAGLGGNRHVAALYLPLLGAVVLHALIQRKITDYLICTVIAFVSSCVGCLINIIVLTPDYHFASWSGSGMTLRVSMEGFHNLFFGTLRYFGYSYGGAPGTPLASAFSCVLTLIMVVCLLLTLIRKIRKPDEIWLLTLYFTCVYIVFWGIYTFTNMYYSDRYNMQTMTFVIPIIACTLYDMEWKKHRKLCMIGGGVIVGGILISSAFRYARYGSMDKTKEWRLIAEYLVEEQGISEGYATFENGNVLTELSDGEIEVWVWNNLPSKYDVEEIDQWLQEAAHLTVKPKGRMFFLFTNEEYEACPLKAALDSREADYRTDNYRVFIFDNREEMLQCVQ